VCRSSKQLPLVMRVFATYGTRSVPTTIPPRIETDTNEARHTQSATYQLGTTTMLDELKEEEIVNKVGGRFKLSTLIQKRMVALNRGARPLVELQTKNHMETVVQEIIQDKIFLDPTGKVGTREDGPTSDAGPTLDDL
jgi:DNA-directed RNA polymerase subunit omega